MLAVAVRPVDVDERGEAIDDQREVVVFLARRLGEQLADELLEPVATLGLAHTRAIACALAMLKSPSNSESPTVGKATISRTSCMGAAPAARPTEHAAQPRDDRREPVAATVPATVELGPDGHPACLEPTRLHIELARVRVEPAVVHALDLRNDRSEHVHHDEGVWQSPRSAFETHQMRRSIGARAAGGVGRRSAPCVMGGLPISRRRAVADRRRTPTERLAPHHIERSPCHKFFSLKTRGERSYRNREPNCWTPRRSSPPPNAEHRNGEVKDYRLSAFQGWIVGRRAQSGLPA